MKNLKVRAALAMAGAITIIGLAANPAAAFYATGSCNAYGTFGTKIGTLSFTNYSKGSGQEYHWSVTSVNSYWKAARVYVSGAEVWRGSAPAQGYKSMPSPTYSYTLKAEWRAADGELGMVSCSKRL